MTISSILPTDLKSGLCRPSSKFVSSILGVEECAKRRRAYLRQYDSSWLEGIFGESKNKHFPFRFISNDGINHLNIMLCA